MSTGILVKIENNEDNDPIDAPDDIHDGRIRHGSAYYRFFKDIYNSVLAEHENDDTANELNPYYA